MKIIDKSVVVMHYTLTSDEGDTIDSSIGDQPMAFIQGIGMLIPGLEAALAGKEKGYKSNVKVNPKEGYGERSDDASFTVPKEGFKSENGEELIIGMQVQVETEGGPALAIVSGIEGEDVNLDMNHPLAGMNLNFDVEIVDVRAATDEELEHGHVHGPGGHQH
jgi:FKBP-type peptidyl-prolyl cis-trans isomerase SlyD